MRGRKGRRHRKTSVLAAAGLVLAAGMGSARADTLPERFAEQALIGAWECDGYVREPEAPDLSYISEIRRHADGRYVRRQWLSDRQMGSLIVSETRDSGLWSSDGEAITYLADLLELVSITVDGFNVDSATLSRFQDGYNQSGEGIEPAVFFLTHVDASSYAGYNSPDSGATCERLQSPDVS